jgi:hypothetical protein
VIRKHPEVDHQFAARLLQLAKEMREDPINVPRRK